MDDLSLEIFNSLVEKEIRIIGEKREEYEGEVSEGFNCDFERKKVTLTKDTICIESEGKKYEIAMHTEYGECASGWVPASWSIMEIREVKDFGKLTHKIKKPTIVRISNEILSDMSDEHLGIRCGDNIIDVNDSIFGGGITFKTPIFSWEPIGGDAWYPYGYYKVNDDAFVEIDYQKEVNKAKSNVIDQVEIKKQKDNELTKEQLENAQKEFITFFKATIPELPYRQVRKPIVMKDGEAMSVQASEYHYCIPRINGLDRYEYYEIGFPTSLFEELDGRGEEPNTTKTVFPGIEEDLIVKIIAKHGGIDFEKSLEPEQYEKLPEAQKRNPQEMTLDQLSEMVSNLAKIVEEQRKAIEAMRYMSRNQDPKKSIYD